MIYACEDRKFVEREFFRMGFDKDARWRISDINKEFELCNTYPRFLIIPADFKEEDLDAVAKFRYFRRIPVAVWRHLKNGCFIVRSSQPTVGWFGWFRNEPDEQLVRNFVDNTIPPNSEQINDNASARVMSESIDNSSIKRADSVDNNDPSERLVPAVHDSKATSHSVHGGTDQDKSELDKTGERTQPDDDSIAFNTNSTTDDLPAPTSKVDPDQESVDGNQNSHNNNLQVSTKVPIEGDGKLADLQSDKDPVSEKNRPESASPDQTTKQTVDVETSMASYGNGVSQLENSISSTTNTSSTSISTSKMLIIDARSYTAAMANRAKGGGCECSEYYQRCEVQFMNLANIHGIRKSFQAIRSVCEAYSEQSNNWVSFLDNSRWLHHISGLLKSALLIVDAIDVEDKSILIHCSDGWDRTPQLVALAEIMLDPHYRTFDGFRSLVQREWLDFGHKFADRCGSNPCNEDPNERCPVFLQWLDCVQQLLMQYPTSFEFNSRYLDKLNRHTYSNVFSTFAYNSNQERILSKVDERLFSIWPYIESMKRKFRNDNYVENDAILRPSSKVRDLCFWKEVYMPPLKTQPPFVPSDSDIDNKKFYNSFYIDGITRTVCK